MLMSRAGLEPATIGLKVGTGEGRTRVSRATEGICPDPGKVDKVYRGSDRAFVHFRAGR